MIDLPDSETRAPTRAANARWLSGWPAIGPALLAVLLSYRTIAIAGLEPPIGLSIAASMIAIAWAAFTRRRWAAPLLLVGPIALIASPAGTELSFNLARPDETSWFVFAVLVCVSAGFSLAGAVALLAPTPAARWALAPLVIVGTYAFGWLLVTIDPQPDLGADLSAERIAELPQTRLVNFSYGLPPSDLIVDVDGQSRLQVRLVNSSDLPHTFTIDDLGVDVYVPAGRQALVDLAVTDAPDVVTLHCAIGDHRQLGMVTEVALR